MGGKPAAQKDGRQGREQLEWPSASALTRLKKLQNHEPAKCRNSTIKNCQNADRKD